MANHFIKHQFALKNNCPECYSTDGLQLTFNQKVVENSLFNLTTNKVTHKLACATCNTTIYPVRWTDDIDRVFDYHQKAVDLKKTSFKLKKAGWLLVCVVVIALITTAVVPFL